MRIEDLFVLRTKTEDPAPDEGLGSSVGTGLVNTRHWLGWNLDDPAALDLAKGNTLSFSFVIQHQGGLPEFSQVILYPDYSFFAGCCYEPALVPRHPARVGTQL